MYEYIKGQIAELTPTYAVLDAGGVGYFINISLNTYSEIEQLESAKLYVHHMVREDAQTLFGFSQKVERELFRHLISVSGVGGNTARTILSTYSPKELKSIIQSENAVLLKNVKGLGLKTAQKIIVELSGKLSTLDIQSSDSGSAVGIADLTDYNETISALTMLGFTKSSVEKVVKSIFKELPNISVEDAIRAALKRL